MRIVSVTHYFPSRKGGIEAVALEINRRLSKKGHHVEWFASAEANLPEQLQGVRLRPIRALHVVERLIGIPLPIWLSADVRHLASAIRTCDLVHIHDFIYPGSILAALLAAYFRKPVVLTQHIGKIPYRNPLLRHLLGFVNRSLGRIMLQHASRSVFISNAVEQYFRAFCRFSISPHYIPNGVDTDIYYLCPSLSRRQQREELGLEANLPTCLFVGRYVEKKGLRLLEEIVRATPGIQWLFAGSGPLHPGMWNMRNVKTYEGWRQEKLAKLYRAADLLVLPSRGEGFPLVVQEAFASGTAALVSDETAAGCDEARPLLYELPVSGEQIADNWSQALNSLMSTPDTLAQRGRAAAEFASHRWNWDTTVDTYCQVFEKCAPRQK